MRPAHDHPIPERALPSRARRALFYKGIRTLADLSEQKRSDLLQIQGIGALTIRRCEQLLRTYGLTLRPEPVLLIHQARQAGRPLVPDRERVFMGVKWGHAVPEISAGGIPNEGSGRPTEFSMLHEALDTLAAVDPRKARVIELRFFEGLSLEETAEVLNLSADTVLRHWRKARAWLLLELSAKLSSREQIPQIFR